MTKAIKNNLLIPYISIAFMLIALFLQPFNDFLSGYWAITTSESILLTDYVAIGGEGPALFNAGSLMLLSYFVVRKLDLRITGSIFAGILTIGGFAFFGKNILNVSIIYLGVFLYTRYRYIELKSVIVIFLFATGLSPISSVIMFGVGLPLYFSIPLGIFVGLLAGFLLIELSTRVISFHRGYDLYNVGFASGILSFAFFSIFRIAGIEYHTNLIYTNDSHIFLLVLFIVLCLIFFTVGFYLNGLSFRHYKDLLKLSGRAVTDFTRKHNEAVTMINIGLTGLAALGMILLLNVHINGPVLGGLLTIMGFAAFGKHIRNIIPPMLGVVIVAYIFQIELSVPVVLAILFSTGLAPIAGEFGFIIGIIAGMLHLPVVSALGQLHGGVLLYSNGFAAAFTAVIITTFITAFQKREVAPWVSTKK